MRAIPIDNFLEVVQEEPESTAPGAGLPEWARLVAEARQARKAVDGGHWRIGQLATLVEKRYASGALRSFAEEIGESYPTVRRLRWVATRYTSEARMRFSALSFSHFQTVAGLPDRLAWLQRAERGSWSVDRLVRESRSARPAVAAAKEPRAARLRAPVESVRRSLERVAAQVKRRGLSRDDRQWLSRALAEVAAELEELRERLRAGASANGNGRPQANGNGQGRVRALSRANGSRSRR